MAQSAKCNNAVELRILFSETTTNQRLEQANDMRTATSKGEPLANNFLTQVANMSFAVRERSGIRLPSVRELRGPP